MPAIKKSDVLDDSVKKAFDDLNASVRLSVDLLVLMTKNAKDINASLGNGSNLSQVAAANSKYNEELKEQARLEQEVLKAEKLRIQVSEQARKAEQAKTKEAEKAAKQSAQNASAYANESKRLNELRQKAKDIALTYGESSKQFKAAAKEVQNLDSKLKKIDSTLGQSQRNVGNYASGWKSFGTVS